MNNSKDIQYVSKKKKKITGRCLSAPRTYPHAAE
jgi:hypothetical protein